MTTHTMRPGTPGTGTYRGVETEGGGRDMIVFPVAILGVLGFFNLLEGIAAIANSHVFVNSTVYVVGDLRAWGWVAAVLGGLQLLAAFGVAVGNQPARWFAIVVVAMNAVGQMFFIPVYPLWSLMIIAVDVVALYALAVYGGRRPVARMPADRY